MCFWNMTGSAYERDILAIARASGTAKETNAATAHAPQTQLFPPRAA